MGLRDFHINDWLDTSRLLELFSNTTSVIFHRNVEPNLWICHGKN